MALLRDLGIADILDLLSVDVLLNANSRLVCSIAKLLCSYVVLLNLSQHESRF